MLEHLKVGIQFMQNIGDKKAITHFEEEIIQQYITGNGMKQAQAQFHNYMAEVGYDITLYLIQKMKMG